ncbi:ribosome-inactivating family protein [Kitasatospora sp. NPDC058397]|uniref:ribosome-inactivating family protein n=1 Tax=unclassified Kitasatospora TaxID=2633591 RepID=UPI003648C23D
MYLHPTSTMRRAGRRLAVLLLAMAAACGLVNGLAAPHADANTTQRWTDIDWDMTGYDSAARPSSAAANQSGEYRRVVDRMREIAGQPMAGLPNAPYFSDTTVRGRETATNRVIRVLVWSNAVTPSNPRGERRADVALYFSVDNLYFMGFSSHGLHYRLNAPYTVRLAEEMRVRFNMPTAPLLNTISSDGGYASLAANPTWRGDQPYTASNFLTHLSALDTATSANRNSNAVLRAMAYFIGATSEAARFGWIENRIASVLIYNGDPTETSRPANIGRFGTDLENNWDTLSTVAHRSARGQNTTAVNIDGRQYADWEDIYGGETANPIIVPFLAIQGSGL